LKIAFFTIASCNYLPYVRVLMDSISRFHPDSRRLLCLADVLPAVCRAEDFEVVQSDQLGIPSFEDFAFRYDIMEFNTAVKPFMLQWLSRNTDCDAFVYLDPDIQLYAPLEEVVAALGGSASVVLTPHITRPLPDEATPNDLSMLQAGVFNLGFIAVARNGDAAEFVDWWARKLTTQCVSDVPSGLFVDQKWCDLAPCLVERLYVLRDPGYNVAYWNLSYRRPSRTSDGWLINGSRLRFFHFSGVDPDNPVALSKHQRRFPTAASAGVDELVSNYCAMLKAAGWGERSSTYAYGCHEDGTPLHGILRRLYRSMHTKPHAGRPFSEPLSSWANTVVFNRPPVTVTALMSIVYRLRPDLQAAFPAMSSDAQSAARFADWFETTGPREYQLPLSLCMQSAIQGKPEGIKKNYVGSP
jgi:hypothetical protein